MYRSLVVLAIAVASVFILSGDADAQGLTLNSSRYLSSHGSSHSQISRVHGPTRGYGSAIDYSNRNYNSQRSYRSGYSRDSSYGIYSSPYYSSPYQSNSSVYGYGYSYGDSYRSSYYGR